MATSDSPPVRSMELVPVPDRWYPEYLEEHYQDLSGRVAVVTGANSGTGFWAAAALARMGATVVLACRSVEKAQLVKDEIVGSMRALRSDVLIPADNVVVMQCDNMSFASVRAFVAEFRGKFDRLDFLLLNAGVAARPYRLSEDGHDVQLQTNQVKELWPTIMKTKAMPNEPLRPVTPRVICQSSSYAVIGWAKFDPQRIEFPPHGRGAGLFWWLMPLLNGKGTDALAWKRYASSNVARSAFMVELSRRLKAGLSEGQQPPALVVGAHPGYASTAFQAKVSTEGNAPSASRLKGVSVQSAADGALPMLLPCLLTEQELRGGGADQHIWTGGEFIGPSGGNVSMTGPPARTSRVGGFGANPQHGALVWEHSEQACGTFPVIGREVPTE